jgi:predicted nuclease with TOPRIM domain
VDPQRSRAQRFARFPMFFRRKAANRDLEERLDRVERGLKALEMDWSDILDRLQQRLAKLGRTRQRLEELQAQEHSPESIQQPPLQGLDPISERILRRRNRITSHRAEETEQ